MDESLRAQHSLGLDPSTPLPDEEHDSLEQDAAPGEDQKALGDQELYRPAVRLEIPAVPVPPTETTDGYFKLRPWQVRCSAELSGHRNFILNAPMAAGSSASSPERSLFGFALVYDSPFGSAASLVLCRIF